MRGTTVVGRAAALGAVVLAIAVVIVIVLSSGSAYQVRAIFLNASQIVSGDQVQVAGNAVGSVSNISLTPRGQAELTLSISDPAFQPLRQGTEATVRLTGLSGIANRYVDLRMGPATAPAIPDNGIIGTANTTSAVDLDALFNTLDAPTRQGLQEVIQGSAAQWAGRGQEAQAAWEYLNPAVVSSSVLFAEINRDTGQFTRSIVQTSNLVTNLAQRSGDLSGLVQNLATTTEALASQRTALGESIQRLPAFMRLADTTFVNLRGALDVLTPLVNAAKPVAPKLLAFLDQLEPLAQESVPTVQDLSTVVSRPGPNNDLIDLVELGEPLAAVTVHPVHANGATRPGAFPQTTIALNDATPELATARPYAVDLTGWFEAFSHPGVSDANGNTNRAWTNSAAISGPEQASITSLPVDQQAAAEAQALTSAGLVTGQGDRCPGSMERGGVFFPYSGFPCNPSEVPTGP